MVHQVNQAANQIGLQAEASAANAAMIVVGLEKELNTKLHGINIDLNKNKVDLKKINEYLQKLTDTRPVKNVKKYEEKKAKEKKQSEKKHLAHRGTRPFAWKKRKNLPDKDLILTAAEVDKFKKDEPADLSLLKQYSAIYSKFIFELPPIDKNKEKLHMLEQNLKLPAELLKNIQKRLEKILFEELAGLIKKHILGQLASPQKILEFILKSKKTSSKLNLVFYNEILGAPSQAKKISFIEKTLKDSTELELDNIKELLKVARELEIDPRGFDALLKIDQFKHTRSGGVKIDTSLIEAEKIKSLLLDEFRILRVKQLLEENLINKIAIFWRLNEVTQALRYAGATKDEINKAKTQARRIAWAKSIAILKELHLKRVFSDSYQQFNRYSLSITKYTIKARKLGYDLPKKGVQWIESRLETLALETADYKLKLLKSMQKLGYDKEREENIKQLTFAVERYQHKIKAVPLSFAPAG